MASHFPFLLEEQCEGPYVPTNIPSNIPRQPEVHVRQEVVQHVPNASQFNHPQSQQHLPSSEPHAVAHKMPPQDSVEISMPSSSSTSVVPQSHLQNSTPTKDSANCKQNIPPLPEESCYPNLRGKHVPPEPILKAFINDDGESVMLSWNLSLTKMHADISRYEIYSCLDELSPVQWKKTCVYVTTKRLPMAITLRHFEKEKSYRFIIRAVDTFKHVGPFSKPVIISFS